MALKVNVDRPPTLEEVRLKIEGRYAKALGHSELAGQSVENRMLEVEQYSMHNESQARLAEMFKAALHRVVTGTWKAGSSSGSWSIRTLH